MFLSKSLLKSPKYHLSGNVSALVRRAPNRFFDWVFSQYREKASRCGKLSFCDVSDVSAKNKIEKPSFCLIFLILVHFYEALPLTLDSVGFVEQ